ncbi:MAG TPA: class I SAM-dependent methyltransferase [Solirubrobacterales bacterium]|nr:class I SAM-dependent methyltransferase [Solirubrobacterales bacterium]HMW45803.1 class I SAM-dependent methyltransferase [Solirubrobacterales bacterium]HMX70608.1 class I SAM-dependent methyltransferase [Solirubrobacterales bacterium]HMY26053.1 class I SAM-dependent methyltransferase [Solirubrobacterales bacterium]HNA22881.1 class I SAM-dependent methyltransferase [Solirubrobacterales bacterium]
MPEGPSKTAEYVATFRAVESARPEGERLFSDPYAASFLDGKLRLGAALARNGMGQRLVCRYIDRNWPGSRPSAVIRTRLIDDAVTAAIEGGAEQLAILGAGYDTRGLRLPAAREIPVFELDQPPTQERKKQRLRARDGDLPSNVTYVPFDLLDEGVGAPLERAGFRTGLKSVYIWEGVLSYLTPEAVDQTLAWITASGAPGSRLVYTYVDVALLKQGGEDEPPWSSQVAKVGEPFRYGLDPAKMDAFLGDRGLKPVWDQSTLEAIAQHAVPGGRNAPGFYRVAEAEVLPDR